MFDGLLNKTMTTQRRTVSVSDIGSDTETWADHLTGIACRVQPVSGSERFSLERYNTRITHVIYCRVVDVTETDRVIFDSRTFEVRAVRNIDEQDSFLTILAEELK